MRREIRLFARKIGGQGFVKNYENLGFFLVEYDAVAAPYSTSKKNQVFIIFHEPLTPGFTGEQTNFSSRQRLYWVPLTPNPALHPNHTNFPCFFKNFQFLKCFVRESDFFNLFFIFFRQFLISLLFCTGKFIF